MPRVIKKMGKRASFFCILCILQGNHKCSTTKGSGLESHPSLGLKLMALHIKHKGFGPLLVTYLIHHVGQNNQEKVKRKEASMHIPLGGICFES